MRISNEVNKFVPAEQACTFDYRKNQYVSVKPVFDSKPLWKKKSVHATSERQLALQVQLKVN